jgi:ligand-binding sensor domain-containing protein/signal transduction histidine kinase
MRKALQSVQTQRTGPRSSGNLQFAFFNFHFAIRRFQGRSSWLALIAALVLLVVAAYAVARTATNSAPEPAIEQPPGDTYAEVPDAQAHNEEAAASSLNLHQWGALTLIHGLPSDHVRAITQDSEGTLWFATDNGLARYDGRRIQKVSADGLPVGRIRSLSFDQDGALWVASDNGAGRLLPGERFQPVAESSSHPITAVWCPERGREVLVSEHGLVFDCEVTAAGPGRVSVLGPKETRLLTVEPNRSAPLSLNCVVSHQGKIITGTSGRGLLEISGAKVKEVTSKPRSFFVKSLAVDRKGDIWLGAEAPRAESGLYQATDPARPEKIAAETGSVTGLCFDNRGDLWAITDHRGAFRFKGSRQTDHFTFENTAGGLRSDLLYSVFVDREEVVWFGTDRGICRFDPHSPHVERLPGDFQSNYVRAIARSADGVLWCGTNRGLYFRPPESPDRVTREWKSVDVLAPSPVFSICEVKDGRLLVGASTGLYAASRPTAPSESPSLARIGADSIGQPAPSIRAICRFRSEVYGAEFGHGLERIDDAGLTHVWPAASADKKFREVISLYDDRQGQLWIGTARAGVFWFDGREVREAPGLGQLATGAVWSFAGSGDQGVWIATEHGLYYYDSTKLEEILGGTDVHSVAVSPVTGSVWCATAGSGLYQVLAGAELRPAVSRLDAERGLPSDSVYAVLSEASGEGESLWIGTNRGIATYQPERTPPLLRPVRILGQRQYQPEEIKGLIHLRYPQNSLLVEVMGISTRTFPEQFQYSFSVADGSGKPIKTQVSHEPQFVMGNLKPGDYRVQAFVYGSDLVASSPLAFGFRIGQAPFPWTSTALAVLLSLSLAALGWGYFQNRRLARANRQLGTANLQLAQTRLQLANETENERRRIARDLHDQTLADLRRLLMNADRLAAESGNGDGAQIRQEIESISTEIRHICEDLSPSVLANVGLFAALEWALADAVAHMPEDKRFEYEFIAPDDLEEKLALDQSNRIQIYRIVQEAISNVCRHADCRRVRLVVQDSLASVTDVRPVLASAGQPATLATEQPGPTAASEAVLVVTLEDDGKGIDQSVKRNHSGRGLSNIISRASLIEAEAAWEPRPGGGTLFRLRKHVHLKPHY